MIPGNVDPRRAEKVQRYKPPQANGNAPVEDLTPDYMNISGPDSATANADGIEKITSSDQSLPLSHEELQAASASATSSQQEAVVQTSNGTNVIPTSPQYGVAIISNNTSSDIPNETTTPSTDTVIETTAKTNLANTTGDDIKDMHSTPSRNDRFKVVKIASLEPFRRGRWKCMDYVDENPPPTTQQPTKQTQSATNIQQMSGMQYMQTQSLPQQHFQQMLVQGAFSGSPQGFYQNVPNPMMAQSQYFYPAQATVNLQQVPVQTNSMQPTFINTSQQYFPANVAPHSAASYTTYSTNVHYVPPNLIQTQSSAFVPTSQNVPNAQLPANFQQSQTYAGQSSTAQQPPMVNGHAFSANEQSQQQQVVASSLPTQIAKNVILQPAIVSTNPALINQTVSGALNSQQQQQYNPSYNSNPASIPTNPSPQTNITQATGKQGTPAAATPAVSTIIKPVIPVVNHLPPTSQMNPALVVNQPSSTAVSIATGLVTRNQSISFNQMHFTQMPTIQATQSAHGYELNMPPTNSVYTNPQFIASESNSNDGQGDGSISSVGDGCNSENLENASGEDPAKANPVVNAIDNKIEQAMDLVKSHLMYTVREEVEVLKEKIVELMERIQQLETENTYLKQQISKGQGAAPSSSTNGSNTNGSTPDPSSQTPTQQPTTTQQ